MEEEHSKRPKIPRLPRASARNLLDPSKARGIPRSHNRKFSCCTSLLLEPHSQRVLQILHSLLHGFHWISEMFLPQTQPRLVPLTNVVRTARINSSPTVLHFLVVAWFLYTAARLICLQYPYNSSHSSPSILLKIVCAKACQSASTKGRPHLSLAMWSILVHVF